MDTRAPPITSRTQERCQKVQHHHHQQQQQQKQQQEEVTLPPLSALPAQKPKVKAASSTNWRSGVTTPGVLKHQDIQRRRPYKVLGIGATPLMHACQQADRLRVLKLLREQEETIGYRDRNLRSALHYCMDAGTGGALALAAPELVNAPDAEGHTPLHLAVIAGDAQLVAVLLANGADVNAKDLEGHSVLHWATVCGEVECVRLVLAAGARASSVDLRGGSPLHYAAQCCGAPATAELAIPRKLGLKVLHTLLEFGADVNARDEDGRQPILWAASAGSVEAVLALVRAGGSTLASASDKDGLTALHCAASRGHARCIEALVNLCDAQPDHVDDNGCSSLHYAATLGHADATSLLLKLGADPNRQDRKGRTPVLCAAAKGQLETLKILVQHGASLHARTVRGTGVGHEAVASGRLELLKWLSRRRPSLMDAATQDGKTPLHVAALHGHLDACKLLLDGGVRLNALMRTSKGIAMTALDAALYRAHRDCAKLIQLHGGMTAQHLKSHKSDQAKVSAISSRLRGKQRAMTSSDSEINEPGSRRRQHQHHGHDPELYYEERWIERRTRRRANRRRLSRQDSRSFSEEELRHSKSSSGSRRGERQRRALSENARYEEEEQKGEEEVVDKSGGDDLSQGTGRRRRGRRRGGRKSETQGKREKGDGEKSESESESEEPSRSSSKSDGEGSSVSDDSLEVVVVKRSLETKCEKIVSGVRIKTIRETSNASKGSPPNRNGSNLKKWRKNEFNKSQVNKMTRKGPAKKKSAAEEELRGEKGPSKKKVGAMSSQESVKQVTVVADIHKSDARETSGRKAPEERRTGEVEQETEEQMRNKMDDILGKADELQSALMAKAADLKKDMEEMRQCMSQKSEDKERNEEIKETDEKDNEADNGVGNDSRRDSEPPTKDNAKSEKSLQDKQTTSDKRLSVPSTANESLAASEANGKGSEAPTDMAKEEERTTSEKADDNLADKEGSENVKRESSVGQEVPAPRRKSFVREADLATMKADIKENIERTGDERSSSPTKGDNVGTLTQGETLPAQGESAIPGTEGFRFADETSSSPSTSGKNQTTRRASKSTTGKRRAKATSLMKSILSESSEERSPDRSAIVAVIESPEWDEEDEEELDKEIRRVIGDVEERDEEEKEEEAEEEEEEDEEDEEKDEQEVVESDDLDGDDELGIVRVLPNTSEEETGTRASAIEILPQIQRKSQGRSVRKSSSNDQQQQQRQRRQEQRQQKKQQHQHQQQHRQEDGQMSKRHDSGGRDSGIEPSPRVSKIPRRTLRCCPNSERQETLHMDTITRDVQVSMRRYHLERKIFFQLMELKRLQIRHGRANEHVLVKRQVDAFHKAGMSGPALGVTRYDHQPFTFRHFESFLYEQLRKLQKRPPTPEWCTQAKQCTQKTHRCHHATSAYTSVPIYTYLGGVSPERTSLLPKIEGRGRGHVTVELTHGNEKQVIALPSEKIDHAKRYFVTFSVRGETSDSDKPKKTSDSGNQQPSANNSS